MVIIVKHSIANPKDFWESAQKSLPNLPEAGVTRVIQVMPNADMSEAVCVWEAESIESLDQYLRGKVLDWSSEKYFELNQAAAMGVSV
jgi:hypothetical protein